MNDLQKIRGGRSAAGQVSAHRCSSACGGRNRSTFSPGPTLKRRKIAKTLSDVFVVIAALLVVASVSTAILVGLFICFFVQT
jgi:hypothetical protein